MPLTPTATRTGANSVKYTWSGTAPYDVWQDGIKVLDQTTLTQYIAQTLDGSTNPLPAIEVLDDTDTTTAQSYRFSPRVTFQWRGQADALVYLIQEYVDAEWTTRAAAVETGDGYYQFTTAALDDVTTATWRVRPQDANGYSGDPVTLTHFMVRNPAPPAVSYSYSSGTGNLTVSAG